MLSIHAWLTLAVIVAIFGSLALTQLATDLVMLAGLTVLLVGGVLTPREALAGFANEGVMTVGILYVVVAGLRDTGAMSALAQEWFGKPRSVAAAQLRMMLPVAAISAFMNNTPLVAAMLPAVSDWGRRLQIPLSQLLLPLSYAAILGGLCTLIGTSTNVIVAGLMRDAVAKGTVSSGFSFFTLTPIGLACALAGLTYIVLATRWLLPLRGSPLRDASDPRAYTVEMLVTADGPIAGSSIEEAGLRHLPGSYLAEVDRDGQVMAAVGASFRLQAQDRLVFVGVVDSVLDLQKIRGLAPATDQLFKLDGPRTHRILIEAVVSHQSPLLGKSIREGRFRTQYNAVVIGVARGGERLYQKLGDVVLETGDTLLLEARPAFLQQQRNARDFYLVSGVEDSTPLSREKAPLALGILIGMVLAATLFEQHPWFVARGYSMLHAGLVASFAMLISGCCKAESARRTIDWPVLIVIAAAIGVGTALQNTGLAAVAADLVTGASGSSPWLALATVYLATMLVTELLSNNTAAVLMFPIALASAHALQVDHLPFVVAMTIAASCGFATPLGYQTHMMVFGPGGYRFVDFLRFGIPLNLVVAATTILLTPWVFPFHP